VSFPVFYKYGVYQLIFYAGRVAAAAGYFTFQKGSIKIDFSRKVVKLAGRLYKRQYLGFRAAIAVVYQYQRPVGILYNRRIAEQITQG
jgi:hypothetical protein